MALAGVKSNMRVLVLLWCGVLCAGVGAGAGARRSPRAGRVEEWVRTPEGSRYSSDVIEDALLDVPGLIAKYGYPSEVHHVTTEDGYILELHRIPHGRAQAPAPAPADSPRPVVFLMHGMLDSSAGYLILGPGNALGYRLADEGYDVWLGNARGNYYSRRHLTLDPDDKADDAAFWRFSWDEIGRLDLPAALDHVAAVSGARRLHYVGHSQGGTAFLVLASQRPEYNERIISFQGFAPASFFENNTFAPILLAATYARLIESFAFSVGYPEVLGSYDLFTYLGVNVCADGAPLQPLCLNLPFGLADYLQSYNTSMLPVFLGHAPAGCSIRQLAHYGQSITRGGFRRFDHGLFGNMARYGNWQVPEYDMSLVSAPAHLHFGLSDELVHWADVRSLASVLPRAALHRVPRDTFNHLDFIVAPDVNTILYDHVLSIMRQEETN